MSNKRMKYFCPGVPQFELLKYVNAMLWSLHCGFGNDRLIGLGLGLRLGVCLVKNFKRFHVDKIFRFFLCLHKSPTWGDARSSNRQKWWITIQEFEFRGGMNLVAGIIKSQNNARDVNIAHWMPLVLKVAMSQKLWQYYMQYHTLTTSAHCFLGPLGNPITTQVFLRLVIKSLEH